MTTISSLTLFDLAASELDQLLPQGFELRLVGLEAPQIGGRVGPDGDRFEHLGRIGQGERGIGFLLTAPARCVRRGRPWHSSGPHGSPSSPDIGEPVLGLGIGGTGRGGIRQGVIRGAQAIVVGLGDLGHHQLGARVETVVVDPEEIAVGRAVILDERVLCALSASDLAETRPWTVIRKPSAGVINWPARWARPQIQER